VFLVARHLTPNTKLVEEESSNRRRTSRLPPPRPTQCDVRRNQRLERFNKVMELHRQGISHRKIARRLCLHRETVARYTRVGVFPERATRNYASKTDQFIDYLKKRWQDGCRNTAQLARELKAKGFTGSYCSVRRRVAHWKRSLLNSFP